MNRIVVGLGEVLWDMLPGGKVLGGAPANFAYHISQFGFDGRAVSAVGDDPPGDEILATLDDKGLNHLMARVPFPTGTVQVGLDEAGVPRYEIREGVAWDNIPFGEEVRTLAARTSAVCFGTLAQRDPDALSRRTVKSFIEAMPAESVRIFDINLRQHFYSKELIHDMMTVADVLKLNDDEAAVLSRMFGIAGDERSVCRRLMEMYGLDVAILTCGSTGSHVFGRGAESYLPTPQVRVADTVGAGDSFTAAFIAAHMRGEPLRKAHELAVETAAWVCTQHGAMPELPPSLVGPFSR